MSTPGEGYGQQGQGYGQQPGQGQYGGEPAYAGADGGAPGWGQPAMPPKPRNGMGVAALIFGILALLTCWLPGVGLVLGILAIVFGIVGRGRANRLQATNKGVATTGLVLGILSLIVNVIIAVLFFLGLAAFLNFGGGNTLQQAQQCIANANNQPNPEAVRLAYQQCIDQFGSQLPGGSQPG